MNRFAAPLAELLRRVPIGPAAVLVPLLLLAAGIAVILQSETAYRQQKHEETQVQAEVLAASVVAALDFGDAAAAQEAADAARANRQLRGVSVYDRSGRWIAGYRRDAPSLRLTLDQARVYRTNAVVAEVPVTSAGKRVGTVRMGAEPPPLSTRLGRYVLLGLLVIMAALVIAVLGMAQAALRRANEELAARATALGEANAELRHQMDARAEAEEQLRQAQKMQALGQLTGGIAHDFNNLLTVIQGSADMLNRPGIADDRRRRFAEAIVQASDRAAALTGQLLAFARRQPLQPEVFDVNALINGMTELLDRTLGERFQVVTSLEEIACAVEADRAQLTSALLNVAVNARDAMPEGGTLTIRTRIEKLDRQPMVALSVADSGSGMDAETLTRAMEPFFTTKSAGKGTGLGLSQVYGFATQSGGDLRIESVEGTGTTVTILLPCSDAPLPVEAVTVQSQRPMRTGAVLLVEDNDEVGEFAETLLQELGHQVTRTRSGAEALEVAGTRDFDVVFTDVVMPEMSGIELAEALKDKIPDVPIVLTTGYSDEIARHGTGGRPVLLKPYRAETLAAVLDEALGGRSGE
jgi:signal transduction histidine kinase/CheY-like chemotaxis protein